MHEFARLASTTNNSVPSQAAPLTPAGVDAVFSDTLIPEPNFAPDHDAAIATDAADNSQNCAATEPSSPLNEHLNSVHTAHDTQIYAYGQNAAASLNSADILSYASQNTKADAQNTHADSIINAQAGSQNTEGDQNIDITQIVR